MSVLMDEDTLLAHRKLWVREPTPCRVESPEGLTVPELAVYEGLRANRWGERVRLEQERIAWPAALEAISNALGKHL
ncbi:MAG TPA: Wadjet anti-phage system protein JetD domain-containing protein [Steroidobacteraceae bacterium]|nr:Wadjet anti-phage system protein JetD domain-containing protein [Steroidobacteraceae bacterium]